MTGWKPNRADTVLGFAIIVLAILIIGWNL